MYIKQLIIILIQFCCITIHYANNIDLSIPAENRWSHIVDNYSEQELLDYAAMIDDEITSTNVALKSREIRKLIASTGWKNYTDNAWLQNLKDEIKGLALAFKNKLNGHEVDGFFEEDLFLMNIGYDFSAFCTTGVYQTSNGPILFRNLDWDVNEFRKFTIESDFTKNNKTIFKSIHFLGQVGVLTGMKPGSFAVALNYRKSPDDDFLSKLGIGVLENINRLFRSNIISTSFLLRYSLEHDVDYSSAKTRLTTTPLLSPSYLILAGTDNDQGAIIERKRDSAYTRSFNNQNETETFIVQTNHDVPRPESQNEHWAGDDELLSELYGMGTSTRREAAVNYLKSLNSNDNIEESLMCMLSKKLPVYNKQTIFSAIMSPQSNLIKLSVHSSYIEINNQCIAE